MNVPIVSLQQQHRALADEIAKAVQGVMERTDFILGHDVADFEAEFAAYIGVQHGVGLDSGLSALELALRAYGIGAGDEVIVPAQTFMATASAVSIVGARPVLVEVKLETNTINPALIEAAITPRTRAIIPVHFYGLPADMDEIMDIARKHNLVVIEDASQAHGSTYKGRRIGSIGHVGAFSLYPTKPLGAMGDAGILVTNDAQVADKARTMRNCGQRVKGVHDMIPLNHRLDTLQASVLRIKLPHLDKWNADRQRIAARYNELLADSYVVTPVVPADRTHVYHLYVVRTTQRDTLQAFLKERGVGTAIHYPVPIHMQPFYSHENYHQGQFPVTEQLCAEILSLPMFAEMTDEQVEYVAAQIKEFATAPVMESAK